MQPGWILGMWVAAAAAMLGVLVAAATSSSAPPWWLLALLVALAGAITVGERLRRSAKRSVIVAPPPLEAAADEPDAGRGERSAQRRAAAAGKRRSSSRPPSSADWDVVGEICCALGTRQVDWLRSGDFATPWLEDDGQRVVELEALVAHVVDRPFASRLRTELVTLAAALGAFNEYYLHNTRRDPLVLGGEWRFFRPHHRVQDDENGGDGAALASQSSHLQQLAIGVAQAHEQFRRTASRNQNVRRRIAARESS